MNNCCMLTEIDNHLPQLQNCGFLCFASFEERCLSIPKALSGTRMERTIIFQFKDFKASTDKNLSILSSLLGESDIVALSNDSPMQSVDILSGIIHEFIRLNIKNFIVDISCFNREVLLILLHLLFIDKDKFESIRFVYNSAKEMPTDLSFGLLEVRSVFGYGGLASPLKKDHMIILLGFEHERARQIIDAYEPALVTIAVGSKDRSINSSLHQMNQDSLKQFNSFIDQIPAQVCERSIPIDSPVDTKNELKNIITENSDYNTIIVPLNTKLSTIGAGLLAIENNFIQICYSQMASYNFQNYSKPSDEFYSCDINRLFCSMQ